MKLKIHLESLNILKRSIALIPTMGSIHKGHLQLVKHAKKHSDCVIVTIFVNPIQFNDKLDYLNYPSKEEEDIKMLEEEKVNLIFIPSKKEIYPIDYATYVTVEKYQDIMCAKFRKNHFRGVSTIVSRLFNLIKPNIAIFGEKDFQQFIIIKKLCYDFFLDTKVHSIATVREKDGLAVSSRNSKLNNKQRILSVLVYKSLNTAAKLIETGHSPKKTCMNLSRDLIKKGFSKVDYFEARNESNLELLKDFEYVKARIFIAVYIGNIRLIDNIKVNFINLHKA